MIAIITKSQLQKNIGDIGKQICTIVNHGKPEALILPYFEGCEELMEDYLEDCEMAMNKKNLKKRYKKSLDSGLSNFVI